VGEYVAACIAGVFSLADALKLIVARSRLMQALPADGAMVAVFADVQQVAAMLEPEVAEVAIAAINGAQNVVISGRAEAIARIVTQLESQNIRVKALNLSHAFHSPLMEPMLAAFTEVAQEITYHVPQIKLVANLTGKLAADDIATPEYWVQHVRQPVQFAAGMETLAELGYRVFLEVGAKPTLLGMGRYCLSHADAVWLPSLYPGQSDWQHMLQSLGELYIRGAKVNWSALHPATRRVDLPTYPFQRQRYWADVETDVKKTDVDASNASPLMQLLSAGKTQDLIQHLTQVETFSEAELELLPRLLAALQQQSPLQEFKDWLYEIQWIKQSVEQPAEQSRTANNLQTSGTWLILCDRQGMGEALAKKLQDMQQPYLLLYPDQLDAFEIAIPIHHIVHLWSLDAEALTLEQVEQSLHLGVISVLQVLQRVLKAGLKPKFWLITQDAIALENSLTNPLQTPLWGLGKVLAIEHPELWGGLVDIGTNVTADRLLTELMDAQGEDHLVLRGEQRYVGRLVRRSLPPTKKLSIDPNGTYLITGGLGALGVQVARSLVAQGAKKLVLVSRQPSSSQIQQAIQAIEQAKPSSSLGIEVQVAQADVANKGQMTAVIQAIPKLRGVVHAAGTTNFSPLPDLSEAAMVGVLRPKVLGGWVLHELTRSLDLDFFVNFSSITSIFGSKGQAHYAAANHFLDGLAYYRRSLGLPALSINWSFWGGAGMAAEALQTAAMKQLGLEELPPESAIATFNHLLGSDCTQVTVARVNWKTFKQVFELQGKRSFLAAINDSFPDSSPDSSPDLSTDASTVASIAEPSDLRQRIEAAAPQQRYGLILNALQTEVAKVLRLPNLPDPQRGLFELGMDSLMAIVLLNSIRTQLATDLPIADFMQASTIDAIAQILLQPFVADEEDTVLPSPSPDHLDLNAEATLDLAITPTLPITVPHDISAILLTGATGYLGAFLLRELLDQTSADIYCLVRASNLSSAMQRIQKNLESYQLWHDSLSGRIVPLCGDLAQSLLGLSRDQFDRLAHQIDAVYHNGAVLNFVYPYAALKAPNVQGTQEILRFACQSKTKPVHYISTDGVFDSSDWYGQEVTEDQLPTYTAGIDLGYTQTKWVAENLVVQARDRGLPVSIYRPPLIAGDSRTGVWFTDDFICRFIKGCIQLGSMPIMSNRLTMSPVDYVGRAIVYLSQQPDSLGQAFHLNNPNPAPWTEFVHSINQLGYPVEIVSFEDWISQLVESVSQSPDNAPPDNALSELVPFFLRRWSKDQLSFAELGQRRVQLNCQKTVQRLQGSAIACARVDAKLLGTYFSYFVESGFLSSPKVEV
jgi:thioester reductase-like protein